MSLVVELSGSVCVCVVTAKERRRRRIFVERNNTFLILERKKSFLAFRSERVCPPLFLFMFRLCFIHSLVVVIWCGVNVYDVYVIFLHFISYRLLGAKWKTTFYERCEDETVLNLLIPFHSIFILFHSQNHTYRITPSSFFISLV